MEHPIPRISGVCAECLFEFDLKFGLNCPRCHSEAWLFNAYEDEPALPHVLNDDATAHSKDCDACAMDAEVSWLTTLYNLPDTRV